MAGYKNSILSHNPSLFLTFDGDAFDPFTRKLTATPQKFMDESGKGNHGILHNESETFPAYRMGLPSSNELEPTDQHAISFGWYGHQPTAPGGWTKAFIEVPHATSLAFTENRGSFTTSFLLNKASSEDTWRTVENQNGSPYWTETLVRPLIRKAGVFYIWYQDNWSVQDELRVTYPGGALAYQIDAATFYAKNNVVTFSWEIVETDPGVFVGTARLYLNALIVAQAIHNYFDTYPTSTSSAPIEIAGTINAGGNGNNDRATTNTILDQIFILNKGLTPDEVARLYKKTRSYDNMVLMANPRYYYPMSDTESSINNTMVDLTGNVNGAYYGGTSAVIRQRAAPPKMLGGASVQFVNGGTAAVTYINSGGYTPVFNPTADFTVMFWARFENSDRSVLLAVQDGDSPYNGLLVEANRRGNVTLGGHIQFSTQQGHYVSSRQFQDNGQNYNFADGQFHHITLRRKGNRIELWIDGVLHEGKDAPLAPVEAPGPGQLYLMGAAPGNMNTTGYMSAVALYYYALDPQQIRIHNLYSQIYRIKGTTTLQGNPHQATIRAISHRTGNLVREVLSDNNTGNYTIELYDNSLIDLMALNKQDRNVRYRVYGPITPAVYDDIPN